MRFLARVAVPAFLFLMSSSASAATIAVVQPDNLARLSASGDLVAKRPLPSKPEGLGLQDCLADQRIRFPVQLSQFEQNATLEAWASVDGVDCTNATNRSGSTPSCWRLVPAIPLAATTSVDIAVRELLSGAAPFRPDAQPSDRAQTCGAVDRVDLAVHFLYFSPGAPLTPSASATARIEADTIGPPARTAVVATPAAGGISIRWQALIDGVASDDAVGVTLFCDPDAAESSTTCTSPRLLPAADASSATNAALDPRLECGRVSGNQNNAQVTTIGGQPLVARGASSTATYAIAVAATDAFGNVGPLSVPVCSHAEPAAPRSDDEGCATSGGSSTGGGALLGGVLVVAGALVRRRPKKRR